MNKLLNILAPLVLSQGGADRLSQEPIVLPELPPVVSTQKKIADTRLESLPFISIPDTKSKFEKDGAECYTFGSGELVCMLNKETTQIFVNKDGVKYKLEVLGENTLVTKFVNGKQAQMTMEDVQFIKTMEAQYRLEQPTQPESTQSQESVSKRQFLEGQLAKYGTDTKGTIGGYKSFVFDGKYYGLVNANDKIIISRVEDGVIFNPSRPNYPIPPSIQVLINDTEQKCLQQNLGSCF